MSNQRVVWKIELRADLNTYHLPAGAKALSVGIQRGVPQMWFSCDPTVTEKEPREFLLVGTGHEFPVGGGHFKFVGTMMTDRQEFIFHVFERHSPIAGLIEAIF